MNKFKVALVSAVALAGAGSAEAVETNLYILAGQSNMAGRGLLTDDNKIDLSGVVVWVLPSNDGYFTPAEEPLHHDKTTAGAGPGASFARAMADADPVNVIALLPGAVGGTSMSQQLKDPTPRAANSAVIARRHGVKVKGVLWHQGCSDADTQEKAEAYGENLRKVIKVFREKLGDPKLPFVAGELGRYLATNASYPYWETVNAQMHDVVSKVPYTAIVSSEGLTPNDDNLHFNTESVRTLGARYATAMQALLAPGAAESDTRTDNVVDVPEEPEGGQQTPAEPVAVFPPADYTVDPVNGVDSTDGGNKTFKTIQFALDNAANNKTIEIKKGHYLLDAILAKKKNNDKITLRGETANPRDVVLDGQGVVSCIRSEQGFLTVANLTVTNGVGSYVYQGGYCCGGGMVLLGGMVTNCVVTDCHSYNDSGTMQCALGGGIWISGATSSVIDTLVENCQLHSVGRNGWYVLNGSGVWSNQARLEKVTVRNCGNQISPLDTGNAGPMQGGGAYCSGASVVDCVFSNNCMTGKTSYGAGLYYTGGGRIENCLFEGNSVTYAGGGAYIAANPTQKLLPVCYACTFTNNVVTYAIGSGGAGAFVDGIGRFEKCRFIGNRITSGDPKNSGEGLAVYFSCTNIQKIDDYGMCGLLDCYLAKNDGTGPGYGINGTMGMRLSYYTQNVVSNCVFADNTVASGRTGINAWQVHGPLTVADTLFLNENRSGIRISLNNAPAIVTGDSVVRNCIFKGIGGANDVVTGELIANNDPTLSPKLTFENCTFTDCATTKNGNSATTIIGCSYNANYAPFIFTKGCLFWNNKTISGYANVAYWFKGYENNFSYNRLQPGTETVKPPVALDNVVLTKSPFAEGSLALRRKSEAIDVIAATEDIPDWATADGAKDLGDGSYTLEKVMDYGVHIVFNNRKPRLVNGRLDAGAGEYKPVPGLMLMVR